MSSLSEYVHKLLNEIASDEGFSKFEISSEAGANREDGFLGSLVSVAISGDCKDGSKLENLQLLCKIIPNSADRDGEFKTEKVFEREVLMYTKMLPLITQFQRDKGLTESECFVSYPKCYASIANAAESQYVIIMEDLRTQGFVMWPKRQPAPIAQIELVLREVAKLHSVSFALRDQRPQLFEELRGIKDYYRVIFEHNFMPIMNEAFDRTIPILENREHIDIIADIRKNTLEYFNACLDDGVCEPFGVIGHGDCWNNNYMFRYGDPASSEPTDVRILDFQFSRYQPLVLDLFDILFTTSDKDFRHNHYDYSIKYYYNALSESIRRLGSDPEKLFSFGDLQSQLRKFGKYPFILGLISAPMVLPKADAIPDINQVGQNADRNNGGNAYYEPYDEETQSIFHRRVNDLLTDLIDFGFHKKNY